jgi:hypothetical protein
VKRFVLVAALSGVGLLVPAVASAAIHQIVVKPTFAVYCIAVDNGPAGVTFTMRAPGGGVLRSARSTTPVASQNCDGAATPGAEAFTVNLENSPGATVTADAGAGLVTTFPVPYGTYDASGTTGIFKLANLPATAGVASIGGGAPTAYTGPAYTTPAAVAVGSATIVIASTSGGIPYEATFGASRFLVDASNYGNVTIYGHDPRGAPISVSVVVGGALQQSTTITPAVDDSSYTQVTMPLRIPPAAVVTVTQPGWFSHSLTFASIVGNVSAVAVSVPAVAGEEGTANFNLDFQATGGLSPGDPLACTSFGDAAYMLSQCGTVGARYSATFPVFFAAADQVSVQVTEADGDRGSARLNSSGFITYMSEGAVAGYGLGPNSFLTLTATTPSLVTGTVNGPTYNDGSAYFGGEGGATYLPLKIVSGTAINAAGPATSGVPRTFAANLEAQGSGTTVSGTTYPGAHVSVSLSRPSGSPPLFYGMADGNGAFALDVGPLLSRDSVSVSASDPTGTMISQRYVYPGSPQPLIQGLADQQFVHGTITASALGGGPAGMLWGGDGSAALAVDAPYAYSLDTTLLTDGRHRVTASAAGLYNSLYDYLFVRVDNTAPVLSAGPDQFVGVGYSAVLLTNAYDANGLTSVIATFGDGKTLTQPAAERGQPIRHVYAKAGTYTASVTATDVAGNTTTDTAIVHAVGKLSEQVAGSFPATFKQAKKLKKRKNLSVTFTSKMAGSLSARVLDSKSKVRATATVTFAAANKKGTITVKTKKWAKGRYTVVLQFTDATGTPGPVVLQAMRIR